MKRILNNDSSNSSLPPSTDKKGKSANTYNNRQISDKKCGAQKGHTGKTLTKSEIEQKVKNGVLKHEIKKVGSGKGKYISKFVLDLKIVGVATEIRFYADRDGKIAIPEEYKSDVTYGPVLKSLAVELYSEGVVANDRICSFKHHQWRCYPCIRRKHLFFL